MSMPHSAIPSTGRAVASRASCRPGSLKQAITKAAASSRARIRRAIGCTTCSTWAWVSMPGGPSASVTHSIDGPPAMRKGATARSIALVTASLELGLITTIGALIG